MFKGAYDFVKRTVLDSKMVSKLIAFTVFISAVPLLCVSIALDNKMERFIENELSSSYEQIVNQYVSNINYKLDIYKNLLTNVASSLMINELLSTDVNSSMNEAYEIGKKITNEVGMFLGSNNIRELHNIMIYSYDKSNQIIGAKISSVSAIENEPWYEYVDDMDETTNSFFYITKGTRKRILSFTTPISDINAEKFGQKLGFVKLDINARSFFNLALDYKYRNNTDIFVADRHNNIIYSNVEAEDVKLKNLVLSQVNKNGVEKTYTEIGGQKVILMHKDISQYGWKVIFLFNYNEIDQKARDVSRIIVTIALISSVIVLMFIILFTKKFTQRVGILMKKMAKVESGNMEIEEEIPGNDEISILDKHFNRMVKQLQNEINNNYVHQLEKREAELNALQFQINPHFLYNTLETINSIAEINECYEICEISQKLGEMFRYSINAGNSEFIMLDKELKHIENYIYIQKLRFSDKFEVLYNIKENVFKCKVLKFILQPVIENAVGHGFKNKEGTGCIEINAYIEKDILHITVEDDGNGMDQETLDKLNSYINKKEGNILKKFERNIGLRNVNMRIKLACGDEYGISIDSRLGAGTKVEFKLPVITVDGVV